MTETLQLESERLAQAWMQYEGPMLRDYLIRGVEDPRINLQSILSRHFLIEAIVGKASSLSAIVPELMTEEYRFSAVMNWLLLAVRSDDPEDLEVILYALRHGADNAEGVPIPQFVLQSFSRLPITIGDLVVPNYIQTALDSERRSPTRPVDDNSPSMPGQRPALRCLDTFQMLWRAALSQISPGSSQLKVFEPACGSANDYRFLDAYRMAPFLDYTGYDLCAKNIENARLMFPEISFAATNVFEISRSDKYFDFCFVHDLFEHLSLEGLEAAIHEICRLTRRGLCIGFFNMAEIADHIVRPVDLYHCNTLSMARIKESFARHGFTAQVIHIGSFLGQKIGCDLTHNPNAYTFVLTAH